MKEKVIIRLEELEKSITLDELGQELKISKRELDK